MQKAKERYKRAFNLIELIIVVMVVSILATFALPQFAKTRERAYDNEAKANLKLMQAAEKIYRLEMGVYFGPSSSISAINSNLRLSLPATSKWTYGLENVSGSTADSRATRVGAGGRIWRLLINQDDATCTGSGCP